MDCRNNLPNPQEGKILYNDLISAFGFSLQGTSHASAKEPVPCQDYSDLRYLEKSGILIAAIADGVGSCSLSHWGSYTAVNVCLDSVQESITALSLGNRLILSPDKNSEIKQILLKAFSDAADAVEQLADDAGEIAYNFQSTLTLAIYDGSNLLYGHVGDDGIVVQTSGGNVDMLTARMKGEEASSVYPLQNGKKVWQFGRAAEPVACFFMATDGVLDAFVAKRVDYYGINYCNGINYAFMEDGIYSMAGSSQEATQKTLEKYKAYMLSDAYRSIVSDDLTLIAVVSNRLIANAQRPRFSPKIWNTIQQESDNAKELLLRRGTVQNSFDVSQSVPNRNQQPEPQEPSEPSSPSFPPPKPSKRRFHILPFALLIFLAASLIGIVIGRELLPPVSRADHEALKQDRDSVASSYEDLSQQYAALSETLADVEQQLTEAKSTQDAAAQANQALQAENKKLAQEVQDLQEELDAATEASTDEEANAAAEDTAAGR